MKKNDKISYFIIIWIVYGLIISSGSSVGWWPEEKSDGWYMMAEECEDDGRGGKMCWDYKIDGPFTKSEIDGYFEEDSRSADEFRRKYGTIYNIVPNDTHWLFGLIVNFLIMLGIPYGVYEMLYDKR